MVALAAAVFLFPACSDDGGGADRVVVTSVALNKAAITILTGNTERLFAAVYPSNATNQSVTWSSGDEAVAAVDEEGYVTVSAAGSATVTATTTDGGFTALCSVTVSAVEVKVTGITLNKAETTLGAGESEILTAGIEPAEATNQNVTWASNDPAAAVVSSGGLVAVKGAGAVAVYGVSSTIAVKSKLANSLGIYDMSGNVWEWCFDRYMISSGRLRRGGDWSNDYYLRVGFFDPTSPSNGWGA